MAIKKGDRLRSRRSGTVRTVAGFTTKPDNVRRARLAAADGSETKIRTDLIKNNYTPV